MPGELRATAPTSATHARAAAIGVATSGSTNAAFRWTGPATGELVGAVRRASPQSVGEVAPRAPASSARATPGSSKRRTMSPKSWCWSIVWGAPTPWSSGGRSAVRTSSGTKAWDASATQACSSAAAVPLVTTIATGIRVTRARPSAKNPALRSSMRTCTCSSARRGAREGERRRTRTGTEHHVAQTRGESTRRTASPRTWPAPHSGSVRSVAMSLLGVQRRGSGPLLVWLHGFTQTKDSAHQFRSILAGTNEVLTLDLPGHGENAAIVASLDETADLLAEVLPGRAIRPGRLLLRCARRTALRAAPPRSRSRRLVVLGATRGIRDDAEREERRRSDDELADHIEIDRRGGLPRRVARSRDVRVATQ